jgi:hypothetical protein
LQAIAGAFSLGFFQSGECFIQPFLRGKHLSARINSGTVWICCIQNILQLTDQLSTNVRFDGGA